MLDAENKALGKVVVEDKSAEIGKLNKQIQDVQDEINDKRQNRQDAKAAERRKTALEHKLHELESQNAEMGVVNVVDNSTEIGQLNKQIDDQEQSIKDKRRKQQRNKDNEYELLVINQATLSNC